jgi:hypothetical protein
MAEKTSAGCGRLIRTTTAYKKSGKDDGGGNGIGRGSVKEQINYITLGEPPYFWLAKSARGLSSVAEPR